MREVEFIPVYQKLIEFYRSRIIRQEILPGNQIDSISRIMHRHSVSRETAKLVLNRLAEEGLIIKKTGKGSYVNYRIHTEKVWGMVIPFFSSNIEQLIGHLREEASTRGRRLEYFFGYNNPDEEISLVGKMIQEGYEAVIVVPNFDESLTANFYRHLFSGNTRVILIDYTMAGSHFKYVIQSYDLGVKKAMEFFLHNTSGNLLFVKNATWKGRNMVQELMEDTFRDMVRWKAPGRKVIVVNDFHNFTPSLIGRESIEGILTCMDTDAVRILGRLLKHGFRLPDDLRLVNYGNTEITEYFKPGITAVDCGYEEMARKTAALIGNHENINNLEQHIIQPQLIERET